MFIEVDNHIVNTLHISQIYPDIDDHWGETEYYVAMSTCNWRSEESGRAEYYLKCEDEAEMMRVYDNFKDLLGVTEDIKNVRYNKV